MKKKKFEVICSDCKNIIYAFNSWDEFKQFDSEKEQLNGLLKPDFKIALKNLSLKWDISENNILTCPCHIRYEDGRTIFDMGKI